MQVELSVRAILVGGKQRAKMEQRVRFALRRFARQIRKVDVFVAGGTDRLGHNETHCHLEIVTTGGKRVVAYATAERLSDAFAHSLERLRQRLVRRLERRAQRQRRNPLRDNMHDTTSNYLAALT